jgi:hypothetical protein
MLLALWWRPQVRCAPGIVNERWLANTVKFAIPSPCWRLPNHDHADRGIDLSAGTAAR